MEENNIPEEKQNNQGRSPMYHLLRVIVGGYLIYLSYRMFRSMAEDPDSMRWYLILFCILFIVAGVFFIYFSLRAYFRQSKQDREEREQIEAEAAAERARAEEERAKEQGAVVNANMSITERLAAINQAEGVTGDEDGEDEP